MGAHIFQSSTWVMWFCDIAITPIARVLIAYAHNRVCTLALASEINIVHEDAKGSAYSSLRCVAFISGPIHHLSMLDQSITMGVVYAM